MPTTAPRSERRAVSAELLVNLTLRELRGKFKRTALGWGWSVLNPVLNLAVYAAVFGAVMRVEPPVGDPSGLVSYAFFLVTALLPWTFLAASLSATAGSYVNNESLVKKVYFPRAVLPASAVLAAFITLCVEMLVLCAALLLVGNMVLPWVPVLVVVMLLQAVFVLGLGLLLAAANARYRDVVHFVAIFTNVWFYATPIIYPITLVGDSTVPGTSIPAVDVMRLNPMYHFAAAYRDLLYHLQAPGLTQWLVMAAAAAGALGLGLLVHRRVEPRLAELL